MTNARFVYEDEDFAELKEVLETEFAPEDYSAPWEADGEAFTERNYAIEEYFAQVKTELDELESRALNNLRNVLTDARNALVTRLKRTSNIASAVKGLKLPYRRDLQEAVRDMLLRGWEAGGKAARKEMREARQYGFNPDQPRHPKGSKEGGEFAPTRLGQIRGHAELVKLKTVEELRALLNSGTEEERRRFVHRTLGPWDEDLGPGRLRAQAAKLVQLTGPEDVLAFLHPGEGVAYRGGKQFATRLIASWSFDRELAKSFGPVTERKIDRSVLALSLDKAFGTDKLRELLMATAAKYSEEVEHHEYIDDFGRGFAPSAAMRWLRAKAFWITGILDDRLLGDARGVLLNALKTGEPLGDTLEKLFDVFEPWLGNAAVIEDEKPLSPWRLENVVRTNTTESYNHGRLSEFLDPKLVSKGLIIGIRYTAILDERTTEICRFLDNKVFRPTDPDLVTLSPANHFQCRSLVTPIMIGQTIDAADFITDAQKGRARQLADARFLCEHEPAHEYAGWDEGKHPRHPQGSVQGGEFAPKPVADMTSAELWRDGQEYEGRLFGGAYNWTRLETRQRGPKDSFFAKAIPQARERYNAIRERLGLPLVTNWRERPAREQLIQFQPKPQDFSWKPLHTFEYWGCEDDDEEEANHAEVLTEQQLQTAAANVEQLTRQTQQLITQVEALETRASELDTVRKQLTEAQHRAAESAAAVERYRQEIEIRKQPDGSFRARRVPPSEERKE